MATTSISGEGYTSPTTTGCTKTAGSAGLFLHTANVLGADPTSDERRIWSGWLRATRVIDDFIDNQNGNPSLVVESLQNGAPFGSMTEETAQACRNYFDRHGPYQQAEIAGRFFWLQETTKRYRGTESVRELTALRLAEATNYFAAFFKLPPRDRNDKPRDRFNEWVVGFSRSGYLVDSVLDFREDYESGEISVPPNYPNRTSLITIALNETYKAARLTPRLAVLAAARVAVRHSRI